MTLKRAGLRSSAGRLSASRRLAVALGLLGMVMATSCGSVPKTYYYTLRVPAPPAANDPKTNFVLGIEHFRAVEMLRDDRIVYYASPTEVNFYQYHRWSADPPSMLSRLSAQQLEDMGVFAAVLLLPSRDPVDYVLRGRVLNFEEIDYEGSTKGRVVLDLKLLRWRDRKVVWSSTHMVERSAEAGGVPGVVTALNASSAQLLREVLPGLVTEVEREFKESQVPPKETQTPPK